jgi:hypothetical protein
VLLKRVSNSSSVLQCHFSVLPHEQDGMSVIAFSSPEICIVVRGETCFSLILSVMARKSWSATLDPFAAIFLTQLTVGELSLNSAT